MVINAFYIGTLKIFKSVNANIANIGLPFVWTHNFHILAKLNWCLSLLEVQWDLELPVSAIKTR